MAKSNPIVVLSLVAVAVGLAVVEGFKAGFKAPEPEPVDKGKEDLLDEIEKVVPKPAHTLFLLHHVEDDRPCCEIWSDGIMVYSDSRKDEPYENYQTRMFAELNAWETKLGVKAVTARAKHD